MNKIQVSPGVEREVLAVGNGLMVVRFTFAQGAGVPWHSHEHEQSSYIVKGRLKYWIGEQVVELTEGMSVIIPPHVSHRAEALEDTLDINSFTPIREDYL
ncbi:cupin domain-containing protein ['Paenibacillus yunnanensis' Narsing Rao et al. 2020]|uniref:cupin domain-containing protein n=1 Tax=Paenibacillus tengchongensis TaxID=2608684 RepID=UPI00124E9771|nr:cupin domain-containing protein [Paenibacillus tengchongensis]